MDIHKLLTVGKIERVVTINELEIHLATPSMRNVKVDMDPHDMVSQYIVRIGQDDYFTPEKKKDLAVQLREMQVGLITGLANACGEMNKEQDDIIKGMFSGKV